MTIKDKAKNETKSFYRKNNDVPSDFKGYFP